MKSNRILSIFSDRILSCFLDSFLSFFLKGQNSIPKKDRIISIFWIELYLFLIFQIEFYPFLKRDRKLSEKLDSVLESGTQKSGTLECTPKFGSGLGAPLLFEVRSGEGVKIII